jgi:hypothetical protein
VAEFVLGNISASGALTIDFDTGDAGSLTSSTGSITSGGAIAISDGAGASNTFTHGDIDSTNNNIDLTVDILDSQGDVDAGTGKMTIATGLLNASDKTFTAKELTFDGVSGGSFKATAVVADAFTVKNAHLATLTGTFGGKADQSAASAITQVNLTKSDDQYTFNGFRFTAEIVIPAPIPEPEPEVPPDEDVIDVRSVAQITQEQSGGSLFGETLDNEGFRGPKGSEGEKGQIDSFSGSRDRVLESAISYALEKQIQLQPSSPIGISYPDYPQETIVPLFSFNGTDGIVEDAIVKKRNEAQRGSIQSLGLSVVPDYFVPLPILKPNLVTTVQ